MLCKLFLSNSNSSVKSVLSYLFIYLFEVIFGYFPWQLNNMNKKKLRQTRAAANQQQGSIRARLFSIVSRLTHSRGKKERFLLKSNTVVH